MVSKVVWCEPGWVPHHYGFCPDESAWKREMIRLQVKDRPYPTSDGSCTHFDKVVGDDPYSSCSIVTLNHMKRDPLTTITLMVHETSHVWQRVLEAMDEDAPSHEFEAYAMQNMVFRLLAAYEATRGSILRPKERPLS